MVWDIIAIVKDLVKYFTKNNDKHPCPQKHIFFSEIERQRKYIIPNIKLLHHGEFDIGRTMIFSDMINIKFGIWKEAMCQYVSTGKVDTESMDICINNLVDRYTAERIENGIPMIVIKKFNEWHAERTLKLIKYVEQTIIGNSFYSYEEIMNSSLYIHLAMLFTTINDAETTLGNLNGELSGIVYKWITLE